MQYFAIVRELTNIREETLDIEKGTDVLRLLKLLATKHEKLSEYLFDQPTGKPMSFLQFMVNDDVISNLTGLGTPLTEGCRFAIIPPVGGGLICKGLAELEL